MKHAIRKVITHKPRSLIINRSFFGLGNTTCLSTRWLELDDSVPHPFPPPAPPTPPGGLSWMTQR